MQCIMRPVFVIHKRKCIIINYIYIYIFFYSQYNQMTDFETEYVFCKDNRLVLIVECLFAKASTANMGA